MLPKYFGKSGQFLFNEGPSAGEKHAPVTYAISHLRKKMLSCYSGEALKLKDVIKT